ncbi:ribonuclease HII [Mycoplasma marinum]|uniref:ribonuclease HII n=1 Tax=Mycoplasma marinum TaxID=1937190 RepID=UPI002938D26A|nr:ribonuclease HII [Mycoplasma marinum]
MHFFIYTFNTMYKYEREQILKGKKLIAGCDEAGRGPLAGPIVAASCILPLNYKNELINDSKKMTEKNREIAFEQIKADAIAFNIQVLDAQQVDILNPKHGSRVAMAEAVKNLNPQPDYVLVDFETIPTNISQEGIKKGDTLSITIAAASVLAKVTRDRIMVEYSKEYPEYGFESHKGYGTKKHMEALKNFGVTPIHRKSYKPIKELLNK